MPRRRSRRHSVVQKSEEDISSTSTPANGTGEEDSKVTDITLPSTPPPKGEGEEGSEALPDDDTKIVDVVETDKEKKKRKADVEWHTPVAGVLSGSKTVPKHIEKMSEEFAKRQKMNEAFHKQLMERQKQIRDWSNSIQDNLHIFVLYFIDFTSSMGRYKSQLSNIVKTTAHVIDKNFKTSFVKFGCIGYRDPIDRKEDRHSVLPFTNDREKFKKWIDWEACSGGGDGAEDIAGGFQLVNDMISTIEKDRKDTTLVVLHVLDAPQHGMCDGNDDKHNTKVQRDAFANQIQRFVNFRESFKSFEMHYMDVNGSDRMKNFRDQYKDCIRQHLDDPLDLTSFFKVGDPKNNFTKEMLTSTMTSIAASVTLDSAKFKDPYFLTENRVLNSERIMSMFAAKGMNFKNSVSSKDNKVETKSIDDSILIVGADIKKIKTPDDPLFIRKITSYAGTTSLDEYNWSRFDFWNSTTEKDKKHEGLGEIDNTFLTNPIVKIHPKPYGRGKERIAFHALVTEVNNEQNKDLQTSVGPELTQVMEDLTKNEYIPTIVKFNIANVDNIAHKSETHVAASFLARMFNLHSAGIPGLRKVVVLSPVFFRFQSKTKLKGIDKRVMVTPKELKKRSEFTLMAEVLLDEEKEEFQKFVNNNGIRTHLMIPSVGENNKLEYLEKYITLDAFLLFCWIQTEGNYIPTDLQGVYKDGEFLLTDIAACTNNPLAFDSSVNLGSSILSKTVRNAYKTIAEVKPDMITLLSKAYTANGSKSGFDLLKPRKKVSYKRRKRNSGYGYGYPGYGYPGFGCGYGYHY